jgi:hypothetical protein
MTVDDQIHIENFKLINGKQMLINYMEQDGHAILFGLDEIGRKYELSKIKLQEV